MITSPGNARIKSVVQLKQKAKARREEDVFVTEGIRMFREAPVERIREVYISESFSFKRQEEKLKELPHEVVADDVFAKISDTQTPQGILCVMKQYHYQLEDLLIKKNPLLLVLEDIQDPGNLGTMLRTGEGAGVDGVIMSRDTVDIYNPKTIRGTMGSIYRVPFVYADSLKNTIEELKEHNVKVYAAHLKGTDNYDVCSYRRGTAFLIGNEGNGLKSETTEAADVFMRIPMAGQVESLNAAMAAGILMYEAARQRR